MVLTTQEVEASSVQSVGHKEDNDINMEGNIQTHPYRQHHILAYKWTTHKNLLLVSVYNW
jgi:hypothetical protein